MCEYRQFLAYNQFIHLFCDKFRNKLMKNIQLLIAAVAIVFAGCTTTKTATTANRPAADYSKAKNDTERYLLTYYPVAVEQMERHNIPASITLAQAILEGGAGKSGLVAKANNHFGVKADKRWKGKSVKSFDNGRWCNFRAYKNALESYEDHSNFLIVNSRYQFLFELDRDDYKGWAKGLKKAGYAEDKDYDKKLIGIIERYGLYVYDSYSTKEVHKRAESPTVSATSGRREVLKANGLLYILAKEGDTFETLSKEFGISKRSLRNNNDLYKGYSIKEGDTIYLEKKNSKAGREFEFHTTRDGESLYRISQIYGIRLKNIYRMNPQYNSYTKLKVGDVIRLR